MKENIKIALLALISVTLIINTFMKGDSTESVADNSIPQKSNPTPSNNAIAIDGNDVIMENDIVANEPFTSNAPKTLVVFDVLDHDFGIIDQNTEHEKVFKFTNTGKEPLIITNAKGSCGCTVPDYPKHPIAPGAEGEIRVVYSPGKQQNKQTKSVTITANTDPETTVLKIYANVTPSDPAVEQGS